MTARCNSLPTVPCRQSRALDATGAARRQVVVMLVLGASLLLAACGGSDASPEPTEAAVGVTAPAAQSTGATATAPAATATVAAQAATPSPTRTPRPLTTPTPLPPPEPAIGDSVRTDGWVFSVTGFETFQRIGDHTASGMFLYLRMAITNAGATAAPFPFDGLVVVDHEDRTFFLADAATRETLEWDFGFAIDQAFQPGETRNVAVAFDIDVDSTDLTLTSPSRVFAISIEHRDPPK